MQWTMRGWDDLWEDVMMKKSGWNIWILAQTSPWKVVGFSLAFVNLIMWAYNLFIFLLLRTVPQYLDPVEFPSSEEVVWKGQLFPVVLTDKKSK